MVHKLFVVYGTRPEAIKLAPLFLSKDKFAQQQIQLQFIFTGQHRELVAPIHEGFGLRPDVDLALMSSARTLNQLASQTLEKLDQLIEHERPNGVIVQGDTTTAFAGGLAAFYKQVPVFHVEAGLRSGDIYSPYPEEFNRKGIGLFANLHFAPTEHAASNLKKEGVAHSKILITGNTAIDALRWVNARIQREVSASEVHDVGVAQRLILVTLHRRESFGEPLRNALRALKELVHERKDCRVLLFAHLNPQVQSAIAEVCGISIDRLGSNADVFDGRMTVSPPADYFTFIRHLRQAYIILTDSGGIQEEAPHLGLPVLVARDTTERPEAIRAGSSVLVGTNTDLIKQHVQRLLENGELYKQMAQARNPFGDGYATERILAGLTAFFTNTLVSSSQKTTKEMPIGADV